VVEVFLVWVSVGEQESVNDFAVNGLARVTAGETSITGRTVSIIRRTVRHSAVFMAFCELEKYFLLFILSPDFTV